MSIDHSSCDDMLEACIDDIGELIAKLDHYPNTVLAFALQTHLATLLSTLVENGECTAADARTFIQDLERDALQLVSER